MVQFGFRILMSVLLCVHQKRENFSPLLFSTLLQGSNPPLTNFVTYPHCFGTAFTSDITSQLNSRERFRLKKPRPLLLGHSTSYCTYCVACKNAHQLSVKQSRLQYLAFFLLIFLQLNVLEVVAFFYNVIVVQEKSSSQERKFTFLALFPQNYMHWQQLTMSQSYDPYSHSKKRYFPNTREF